MFENTFFFTTNTVFQNSTCVAGIPVCGSPLRDMGRRRNWKRQPLLQCGHPKRELCGERCSLLCELDDWHSATQPASDSDCWNERHPLLQRDLQASRLRMPLTVSSNRSSYVDTLVYVIITEGKMKDGCRLQQ